MSGTRLEIFTGMLEWLLLEHGIARAEIPGLVCSALAFETSDELESAPPLRAQLLQQLLHDTRLPESYEQWRVVPLFAREVRAVRQVSETNSPVAEVTEVGRWLLELTGLDAVKWLLHVEAALSTGWDDPWRISRGTLRYLLDQPRQEPTLEWTLEGPPWSESHVSHLSALGFVIVHGDAPGYRVLDHAVPIFEEIAEARDTPMSLQVAALLEDDISARLPHAPSLSAFAREGPGARGPDAAAALAHDRRVRGR